MVPPGPEACKWLRAPRTYIYTWQCFFPKNVKDYIHTSNVHLYQIKRSNCRIRHQIPKILKDQNFLEDRKFSLGISGPKVVPVLFCNFLYYQAVWSIGDRSLRPQPRQRHGWSGPDHTLHKGILFHLQFRRITARKINVVNW